MKKTFQQLYVNFPQVTHKFSFWMLSQYKIREEDYDDSISEHRYIIAARFFGESTDLPTFLNADGLEDRIEDMFDRYQKAEAIVSNQDPLDKLSNLDWKTRNDMTEKLFTRKTNPGLRDTLIRLTNFRLPALSDALIPLKVKKPEFGLKDQALETVMDNHQLWLDNIRWAWDVKANKIEIPF